MPIVSFQSALSTVRKLFKSHATLKAESIIKLVPILKELEDIFKKYGFDGRSNKVRVLLEYFYELREAKFSLQGIYEKTQEENFKQAWAEANKLLRTNRIQYSLVTKKTYCPSAVHLFSEFLIPEGGSLKDVFIPRDGNWQDDEN